MKFRHICASLGVFCFAILLTSCLTPQESNPDSNGLRPNINTNFNSNMGNSNANEVDDDEVALNTLVNLPFEPKESVWREEKIEANANSNQEPGEIGSKLTAVLRFSENEIGSLVGGSDKAPFATELEAENWFPAELIAKGETSGDHTLKGTAYSAARFFKPPYTSGSLIRIKETDYFVLILQSK